MPCFEALQTTMRPAGGRQVRGSAARMRVSMVCTSAGLTGFACRRYSYCCHCGCPARLPRGLTATCPRGLTAACPSNDHADIQVRLLLSIDRRQSAEDALDTAQLAVRLKDEGVAGLDLSGNPSVGQVDTRGQRIAYMRQGSPTQHRTPVSLWDPSCVVVLVHSYVLCSGTRGGPRWTMRGSRASKSQCTPARSGTQASFLGHRHGPLPPAAAIRHLMPFRLATVMRMERSPMRPCS